MLSNSSKSAIKAVIYLAVNSSKEKKIMVKDIYEDIDVSQTYLAKLLQELSRQNVISSIKGPKGGFYLTEENLDSSLLDIVSVIDGETRIKSCVLGINECNTDNPCALHYQLGSFKKSFMENLKKIKIKDLIHNLDKADLFISN
jgi:Rrf2 family protein